MDLHHVSSWCWFLLGGTSNQAFDQSVKKHTDESHAPSPPQSSLSRHTACCSCEGSSDGARGEYGSFCRRAFRDIGELGLHREGRGQSLKPEAISLRMLSLRANYNVYHIMPRFGMMMMMMMMLVSWSSVLQGAPSKRMQSLSLFDQRFGVLAPSHTEGCRCNP